MDQDLKIVQNSNKDMRPPLQVEVSSTSAWLRHDFVSDGLTKKTKDKRIYWAFRESFIFLHFLLNSHQLSRNLNLNKYGGSWTFTFNERRRSSLEFRSIFKHWSIKTTYYFTIPLYLEVGSKCSLGVFVSDIRFLELLANAMVRHTIVDKFFHL